MLQKMKRFFKQGGKKETWAEKQVKEMAKLRGKLILMQVKQEQKKRNTSIDILKAGGTRIVVSLSLLKIRLTNKKVKYFYQC